MRRTSRFLALGLVLLLALAPGLAMARVGNGGSFGSRGSRTYSAPPSTSTSPYGASPLQNSLTQPGYAGGGYNGGYGGGYGRSGFGSGLAGGLLGFGLGSLLFGHHYGGGYGYGGGMGLFGGLIRLLLIFFVVRWLFRRFFGRGPGLGMPGLGGRFGFGGARGPSLFGAAQGIPLAGPPVAIQPSDFTAFEVLLKNIQAAWSNADLNALRGMATPEMVSNLAEQLADYASRGQRNVVADVRLQKGDLSEAWAEAGRTYATVAMNFSMTDATYDRSGRVVDGSPTEHVSATEYWTFLRADGGGHWVLSAIQQGR